MIIAERVNQYLTQRRPDELCDSCVADAMIGSGLARNYDGGKKQGWC